MRIGCFALVQPFGGMRRENLCEPLRWAVESGLQLIIEPHGGVRFDTGTSWLGGGVVGIEAIVRALMKVGFDGDVTIEIVGAEKVKKSAEWLRVWIAEA